jgi:hypothetical protein
MRGKDLADAGPDAYMCSPGVERAVEEEESGDEWMMKEWGGEALFKSVTSEAVRWNGNLDGLGRGQESD